MNADNRDLVLENNPPSQSVTDKLSDFELWGILANTCYAILRARFLENGRIGLTPQKAEILFIIESNGGSILQNRISGITMRRQNSVSDIVNRMVRERLITKQRLPDDRKYLITMGKKGREKYDKLTRNSIEMIFSALTPQDCQTLNSVLKKLLNKSSSLLNLEVHLPPPGNNRRQISYYYLWVVLARTHYAISRLRLLEIAEGGLTPEKATILHIIKINGGSILQNQISGITMRRQHSVSDLVNRMVREGLITKTKASENRAYIIQMLKKGQEKFQNLNGNTLNIIYAVLNAEDRKNMYSILFKLLSKSRSVLGLDYTAPF